MADLTLDHVVIAVRDLGAATQDYEALLNETDNDIFDWATGRNAVPPDKDTPVLREMLAFKVRF